jgi:hypothetical protein
MIDFEHLRDQATEFVEEHSDQIDSGIDKAAGMAGRRYGHRDQIEQGADKLKDLLPADQADEAGEADERRRGRHTAAPGRHSNPGRQQGGGPRHAAGEGRRHRPQDG